jgi:glycosyltransferase involved in cell wall biosynthesis
MCQYTDIRYLSENPIHSNDAGNKARKDVDQILNDMHFSSVAHFNLVPNGFKSKYEHLLYNLQTSYITSLLNLINTHATTLILQYPFYFERIENIFLDRAIRKNKTILLVHDIDSLRFPITVDGADTLDLKKIRKEKDIFNEARVIIVHNSHMKDILRKLGVTTPIVELNLFDYLLPNKDIDNKRVLGSVISYAGNLAKSRFFEVEEIKQLNIDFNLYGSNYNKDKIPWQNIHYRGSFSPEEIPYKIDGNFGLIWDGTSIKKCDGWTGKYMKFNNPHKLSLYIAAGMPVITWNQAAIADFIKKHNIGFCVNALEEIDERISGLTEEKYQMYINNLHKLQQKVTLGSFTREAIKKAISLLQ